MRNYNINLYGNTGHNQFSTSEAQMLDSFPLCSDIYIIAQNRHKDPQAPLSAKDIKYMNGYYSLCLKSPRISQKVKGKHIDCRIRRKKVF